VKEVLLKGGRHDGCKHMTDAQPGQAFWILGRTLIEDEQYIVAEDGLSAEVNE